MGWGVLYCVLRDSRVVLPVMGTKSCKCLSSFSSKSAELAEFLGVDYREAALGHLRPGLIVRNNGVLKCERTAARGSGRR